MKCRTKYTDDLSSLCRMIVSTSHKYDIDECRVVAIVVLIINYVVIEVFIPDHSYLSNYYQTHKSFHRQGGYKSLVADTL